MLKPIPVYPAYIKDQCGALWGIPATLMGEYDKVHITVETTTGDPVDQNAIDVFIVDGALYVEHTYYAEPKDKGASREIAETPVECIDTYKQTGDTIELVKNAPDKPTEARATLSGVKWKIETSVINGEAFSYLYNLDPDMIEAQGNYGGKGAYMGAWSEITGYVELDRGILIMTPTGARFYPTNRAGGADVSEKGRLWK